MQVREATVADAEPIARVLVYTFLVAHRDQIPEAVWLWREREWTPTFVSQVWERVLRDIANGVRLGEGIFVAEETSGEIVGIAKVEPVMTEEDRVIGEVTSLYVHPVHQRRGVGRGLLAAVVAHQTARGVTELQVATLVTNTPARRFYEALGAKLFAERKIMENGHPLRESIYRWFEIDCMDWT